MTQAVPLYIVLIVLAAAVVLWLVHRWVLALVESARRTQAALDQNRQVLSAVGAVLEPAAAELRAHLPLVPKLLEAVAQVGNAQLEALQAQRAREQNPFGKRNGPAPPRDVEGANREYEIQERMRAEGIGREEAELRENPANYESVWGSGMFQDWGR